MTPTCLRPGLSHTFQIIVSCPCCISTVPPELESFLSWSLPQGIAQLHIRTYRQCGTCFVLSDPSSVGFIGFPRSSSPVGDRVHDLLSQTIVSFVYDYVCAVELVLRCMFASLYVLHSGLQDLRPHLRLIDPKDLLWLHAVLLYKH